MATSAPASTPTASPPTVGAARLAEAVARDPEAVALRWQDRDETYAELADAVARGAGVLDRLGVEPGDRVAMVLGNVPAFAEAWFAAQHLGAVAVPLNPALAPDELRHALDDSGAKVVVVGAGTTEAVQEAVAELDTAPQVVVVGAEAKGTAGRWSHLLEEADALPACEVGADDLATIVYTSGTTGRPRGAMLTHGNLAANQDQSLAGRVEVRPDDRVLLVLPASHIYGLNVGIGACLHAGATVVLQERFDPTSTLDLVRREGITVLLGAPPMYAAWVALDAGADAFSSVRLAVSGAAGLPERTYRDFAEAYGLEILEGYGLTEASPSVASNAMAERPRPGSVGRPLPGVELRLVDEKLRDVEQGDPGEVLVRGPNVFSGYWDDPAATAEALVDGWLRTGDVGILDEEGHLHLVDRIKDLVLVSGFNVYPREVERALATHPAVAEVAVVGVPHPYTGEAVKAFVVARGPADEREVTDDELTEHCRRLLARYKCPESIEFVAELPHTATGKVRRAALRQRA